ncbi:MAG: FMN-binding protein [candidate division WOR-3 bacterium]|nr:FMN-binding protein [candidate division WOR-3 bacterium]
MKSSAWMVISLVIVCLISGGLLARVYLSTKPRIEAQKQFELRQRLTELLPSAKQFNEIIRDTLWIGLDENNRPTGIIFRVAPLGYGGPIPILVALNCDTTINKIYIGSAAEGLKETPGLGYKVRDEEFLNQFINKNYHALSLVRDGGTIQAITGATISSQAVINGIKLGISRFAQYLPVKDSILIKEDTIQSIEADTIK